MFQSYFWVVGGALLLRLSLVLWDDYRSTDFEVHRNWMAITSSVPMGQWYHESTSQWTLDYPPLFAYFERVLAFFAKFVDPSMVEIQNLDYASRETVIFQRFTVIVSEGLMAYGAYCIADSNATPRRRTKMIGVTLSFVLMNFGIILIDHVHFQYNGFLIGMLLLAIHYAPISGPLAAFWFSALVNFKHIFLYFTPVFATFLVRRHCFNQGFTEQVNGPPVENKEGDQPFDESKKRRERPLVAASEEKVNRNFVNWIVRTRCFGWTFDAKAFLKMFSVAFGVSTVSLGPFIANGSFGALVQRLFPFGRGLCHAYWAPNFWALYLTMDRIMGKALRLAVSDSPTKGLVKVTSTLVLPEVRPAHTFSLVTLASFPLMMLIWKKPRSEFLLIYAALGNAAGFFFGWHVHEKAILYSVIPLAVAVWQLNSISIGRLFFVFNTAASISLLPLLPKATSTVFKLSLLCSTIVLEALTITTLHRRTSPAKQRSDSVFDMLPLPEGKLFGILDQRKFWILWMAGVGPVVGFLDIAHPLLLKTTEKVAFLPLMLVSNFTAVGILVAILGIIAEVCDLPLAEEKSSSATGRGKKVGTNNLPVAPQH